MTFFTTLQLFEDKMDNLYIDALALFPQENIIYFQTNLAMTVTKEIIVVMPNLEALHLVNTEVSDGFLLPNPNGQNAYRKLLPSLRRLYLHGPDAESDDWSPLVRYLTYQSSENHALSLDLYEDDLYRKNMSKGCTGIRRS